MVVFPNVLWVGAPRRSIVPASLGVHRRRLLRSYLLPIINNIIVQIIACNIICDIIVQHIVATAGAPPNITVIAATGL
jgi:hypothetical protein